MKYRYCVLAEITSLTERVLPPLEIPRGHMYVVTPWHSDDTVTKYFEWKMKWIAEKLPSRQIKIPRGLIYIVRDNSDEAFTFYFEGKIKWNCTKNWHHDVYSGSPFPSENHWFDLIWCQVCISVKPSQMSTSCSALFWWLLFTQIQNTTLHSQRLILFK